MSTKIKINRVSGNFHLEAKNENGNIVHMDGSEKIGGENKGVRPMEMLLMALGGCSTIDIISILNKMKQTLTDIHIEIDGQREEGVEPSLFKNIDVKFICKGEVESDKLKRAVDLSMQKYCSVAKTLEKTATINYQTELNGVLI